MKYMRCLIAFILLFALFLPTQVMAAEVTTYTEDVIYFEDGSYITMELTVIESRASTTKSGSKSYICRGGNDDELWRATLTGTFSYTGTSSVCTASSCSVKITDTDWYTISKNASRTSNYAYADVTMGKKFLGITVEEESISIKLTCDRYGNLS